jgi:putative ABC transport system permease protein
VIAQLFVEALVLSLGAAAVGLALAQFGVRMGNRLMEMEMGVPFWTDYSLRPATVLFAVGVAVVSAAIVGVLPALQATGRRLQADLRQLGGGTRMRLGKTWTVLIVAQIAIAVAALPAAVNMGWSEIRNGTTRPTFPAAEFLVAEMRAEAIPDARRGPDARADSANLGNRLDEMLRRLEAEPLVVGATYSTNLPDMTGRVEVEGASAASPSGYRVRSEGVALNYLDLHGARVRAGRAFGPADLAEGVTAVIVNQAFVTQILSGEDALGRRVRYLRRERSATSEEGKKGPWYQIVGVVENLHANDMDPDLVVPGVYRAAPPASAQEASVEVRVRAPTTPADFAPKLREIAAAVDPTLRLGTTYSLDQLDAQGQLAMRLVALVIGLVLLSVFLLSAAGVYALTSFTVIQRRREIGIRTALGAHPKQVLLGVFARVARQLVIGLALGVTAAGVIEVASGGELMGGRGRVLLPAFAVIMALVAFLGALGPARRGLRIQPTEALRGE